MKKLALLSVFLALPLFGQTLPSNVYGFGASYNQSGTPRVAGTALYARLINDGSGTYAFTVFDALPTGTKPFTVTSNIGAGVAQKLFAIGKVNFYAPAATGISFTGSNTGWQWNGGVAASVPVKKSWHLMPNVRFLKSSVGGGGYQPIVGVLFSYQQ